VAPTARALAGRGAYAIASACDAAAALRAGALVEALLALAERPDAPESPEGIPLGDHALAIAWAIAGRVGERSVAGCRRAAAALEPDRRYQQGQPLTLATLTVELESPHSGRLRNAAYNLRSITGEHHGFEPELDFIANLPAVDAWHARAARDAPIAPGGWAWQGCLLAPPRLS
jgi:hypothetical protein